MGTLPVTPGYSQFYTDLESWIWSHYTGSYATVRPEWSKAWACTSAAPWTNAAILQSAISSHGPVKIGVGAADFQTNADGSVTPGTSGWVMYNYPKNQPEDHCVSLCGYGTLAELITLFKHHKVTVHAPKGMPTGLSYAMFTWNSIGIIDQQSMLNMTYEAWIRIPVTIIK